MRVRVESKNLEYKSTVKAKTRVNAKDEYSYKLQIGLLVLETERWSKVTLDTRSDLHHFSNMEFRISTMEGIKLLFLS